jgi:hypothetical protein
MSQNNKVSSIAGPIDPLHILEAIENSLKHSEETSHGVTGLTFQQYTITVRKRKNLCWLVECKFRAVERQAPTLSNEASVGYDA